MSKVWKQPLFPVFDHNTMLTNYDVTIKTNEVKIIDEYVIQNNLPEMNLEVFKSCVCNTLPTWRAEQLVGDFYHDDSGMYNYKKYLNVQNT
jgi:hypothetical protein